MTEHGHPVRCYLDIGFNITGAGTQYGLETFI